MDVFFLAFLCKRHFSASSSWRYFSVARHLLLLYPLCIRLKAASVVTKEQWRLCFYNKKNISPIIYHNGNLKVSYIIVEDLEMTSDDPQLFHPYESPLH